MTREEAVEKLKALHNDDKSLCISTGDPEYAHGQADDILIALLNALGYQDVTAEWEKIEKWFA